MIGRKYLKAMGRKGQSVMEMSILFVVIVFALISMQTYIKRAIQGAWKSGVDEIGDQYDPETTTSDYTTRRYFNASTTSTTQPETRLISGRVGTASARYANLIITISNTQIHYDNTITNGYDHVAAF